MGEEKQRSNMGIYSIILAWERSQGRLLTPKGVSICSPCFGLIGALGDFALSFLGITSCYYHQL